jgi:hypothetical protein
MSYPSYIIRLANYLRDSLLGVISPDPAKLDAEYNQITQQVNSINLALRGITNADGTLKNLAVATAQSLAGAQRFVATASQTVFLTVIPWQSTFTAINVQVTSQGLKIDSNLVSVADSGGFLQVTIPAQTLSNVVFIAAFESGAGILSKLQLQTTGNGASLIAIEDAAGSYTGVTVETALAEIDVTMDALSSTLTTLNTNAILRTGAVPFTANQSMGGFKLTNLAAGTASSNDAARMADITTAALQAILGTYLASAYLALGGGTMTGAIAMGTNKITGMGDGTNAQDAVTKAQLDLKLSLTGGTMSGAIAMGANKITGLADGVADTDAINKAQAEALVGNFSRTLAYFSPGSLPLDIDPGVTKIKVEVWGGGGGGASPGTNTVAYGGGGGGYATAIIPVTPGETLTLTIGAVGTGGGAITTGGDTKISRSGTDLVTGNGGIRGDTTGLGGAYALNASVSGFGINGGNGGCMRIDTTNGDLQHYAAGGDSPRGGSGGRQLMYGGGSGGTTGVTPGGGGAAILGAGDNGGAGGIVISY